MKRYVDTTNFVLFMMDYAAGDVSKDECALWTGYSRNGRYGDMRWQGKMVRVHRLAYELAHYLNPRDLVICHTCDNPKCINPHHLFAGTQEENIHDAQQKGRLPTRKPDKQKEIERLSGRLDLIKKSPLSDEYFANRFNVGVDVIKSIRSDG